MADRPGNTVTIEGFPCAVRTVNTLVVGSGAAGLNAALQLRRRGITKVLLATERLRGGTSYNAGSDKQTYYKLALSGRKDDSPQRMAEDLFRGGCMHGDHALCEAAHSAEAFFHLVHLGVPFPLDRWGNYVGYRTDHDPLGRGTSAGPLTSRFMCERLAEAVRRAGIPVEEHLRLAALLRERSGAAAGRVLGALFLRTGPESGGGPSFVLAAARNVILATGGPAGLFEDTVYPDPGSGALGVALAAGVPARNLTEFQFGIALVHPFRWNLSGSFQQVIPRYVSRDAAGGKEREFLAEGFPDLRTLAGAVFRKGYEWPFDAEKVRGYGSSLVDLLVYHETVVRGRRVFLDFTRNPRGPRNEPFHASVLDPEARAYLERAGALHGATPAERLEKLNPEALELFRSRGLDPAVTPAQAAVCAQHLNGGLSVDAWWHTAIAGLYAVGEAAGTHGVRRPGGAALNAGQVGGIRAALHISRYASGPPPEREAFLAAASGEAGKVLAQARALMERARSEGLPPAEALHEIRARMSGCAGILRDPESIRKAAEEARRLAERLPGTILAKGPAGLAAAFQALDLARVHAAVLEAQCAYLEGGGRSRGSFLVRDAGGEAPCPGLPPAWRFAWAAPGDPGEEEILEVRLDGAGVPRIRSEPVRPIPEMETSFEQVWQAFRSGRFFDQEEKV